jgi:N6-L-threonylcarbamoyladenine synthase
LQQQGREKGVTSRWTLPRPMINTKDYDFSFSGIKTSVLYTVQKQQAHPQVSTTYELSPEAKIELALEFENAVTEVLIAKTRKALEEFNVKTLILGGGVIANTHIREEFKKLIEDFGEVKLLIPDTKLDHRQCDYDCRCGIPQLPKG